MPTRTLREEILFSSILLLLLLTDHGFDSGNITLGLDELLGVIQLIRRVQRGRMTGKAMRGNTVTYGEFGLVATEPAWITSNQIEAARIAMTRYTKRGGQVWIKIFPDKPVTQKPAETRMGSGKGSPEYWVAVVKPGRVMFEIAGVPEDVAREALRLASHKLPIKTKVVKREDTETQEVGE